jgi:hypothetical protein
LPAGAWQITILAASGALQAGVTADFDGQPAALPAGPNAALTIRTATPGWHRLTLRAGPQAAPTVLQRFLITAATQA